jgi:hypothetical protein
MKPTRVKNRDKKVKRGEKKEEIKNQIEKVE